MNLTGQTARPTPDPPLPPRPPRRRVHWWRWVGVVVLVALLAVVGAVRAFVSAPSPAPLALLAGAAAAPVGALDGTWTIVDGSLAGFRVRESALGASNDTVGRTSAVTGTLTIADGSVTAASFAIDLTTLTAAGKPLPQLAASLGTAADPTATFTLAAPIPLDGELAAGGEVSDRVAGALSMHGTTHEATFDVVERRDGSRLQVAGSSPVAFDDWGITGPQGYGLLGSLADHGVAELVLVLERA